MATITFEEFVKMVDTADKVEVFLSWMDQPLPIYIEETYKDKVDISYEGDDPITIHKTDTFESDEDGSEVTVKSKDDEYSFSFFTKKKKKD